ncbi:hypothetical protein [Aureivirga sp. CE67]|uniref:FEKKY domain-containing protein n=1 Tax=Aureivirga sp. CE67 TaxID=1788983 RepID=UPI0018CBDEB3|nr:hypothetical protein [Aureivirga sp. CE67]
MKKTFLTLILILTFTVSKANEKEIIADVVFVNLTGMEFTSGEFRIANLNENIEVTKAENFKITLPEKGKYEFNFKSDDFLAYIFYPKRINKNRKTITIRLIQKNENKSDFAFSFANNLVTDLSNKQIEERISNGTLNFIMDENPSSKSREYLQFEEKYGVGLMKKKINFVDPITVRIIKKHNKMIFDYLNKKYGVKWSEDLKTKPFGIE